ncbi:transposase [Nitrosomonas cryotolerans]|uniref:transposase n=1 Tax=Nitrosomonas cryotolerans TaxID=44575 RepID=UPI001C434359
MRLRQRDSCDSESSRMIRKKNYSCIRKKLWGSALWSPFDFAASCGSAPIAIIRQSSNNNKRRIDRQ